MLIITVIASTIYFSIFSPISAGDLMIMNMPMWMFGKTWNCSPNLYSRSEHISLFSALITYEVSYLEQGNRCQITGSLLVFAVCFATLPALFYVALEMYTKLVDDTNPRINDLLEDNKKTTKLTDDWVTTVSIFYLANTICE